MTGTWSTTLDFQFEAIIFQSNADESLCAGQIALLAVFENRLSFSIWKQVILTLNLTGWVYVLGQ